MCVVRLCASTAFKRPKKRKTNKRDTKKWFLFLINRFSIPSWLARRTSGTTNNCVLTMLWHALVVGVILPLTVLTSTSSHPLPLPPPPWPLNVPWYTRPKAPSCSTRSSLTGAPRASNKRMRSSRSSHILRSLTAIYTCTSIHIKTMRRV